VLVAVLVAIAVPQFGIAMSLLGSLMAFGICVISPIAAQVAITGHWSKSDLALLVIAVIMAVWGTGACALDQVLGM
jgi:vesicular inhibitory amino acid transporter